jgi:hypothetical protein
MIARDGSTGAQGYIDAGGTWYAFALPSSVPAGQPNPAAPDVSPPEAARTSSTSTGSRSAKSRRNPVIAKQK